MFIFHVIALLIKVEASKRPRDVKRSYHFK